MLEFHRSSSTAKSQFLSITLNGKKFYVNRSYSPRSNSIKNINVAFQMDGDKYQTDYSVYLDSRKTSWW